MTEHAKKAFRELSGGLKRRVILARALVHDPRLLILDEPTAGVDVELRRDLWRYLQELNRDGKTILLTSHYLEEVERLCRTIAVVAKGGIVRNGPKAEFMTGDGLEKAYLRRPARSRTTSRERRHDDGHDVKRTPMGINWIGLGTIVRREVSRIMRVPIQAVRRAVDLGAAVHLHLRLRARRPHQGDRRAPLSRIRAARHPDDEHHQRRVPAIDLGDLFPALPALHRGDAGGAALLCGDDRAACWSAS